MRLGDTLTEKLRLMDSIPCDEDSDSEQQKDSQFMGAVSIISTEGTGHSARSLRCVHVNSLG